MRSSVYHDTPFRSKNRYIKNRPAPENASGALRWQSALALALLLPLSACESGPQQFTLEFVPMVGTEAFQCGSTYSGIGTGETSITPLDFRLYVHDVTLIGADGSSTPLELTQDGVWQRDTIALLDFEDGTGDCETGSPLTRMVVEGTAPAGDYTGVAFTLGIPASYNHLDAATAPPPLNVPGLWWSWSGGYKYARLDVRTPNNPAFYFHLGATNCSGDSSSGYDCAYQNLPRITLMNTVPGEDHIVMDLKHFYANSDLEHPVDYVSDYVSGCMAFSGDPECEPLFNVLGMTFEAATANPPAQSLFTVLAAEDAHGGHNE